MAKKTPMEEGQCGKVFSVRSCPGDAARQEKAPGAGKHLQPEHKKPHQAAQSKGEPLAENLIRSLNTTNPSKRCNKEG